MSCSFICTRIIPDWLAGWLAGCLATSFQHIRNVSQRMKLCVVVTVGSYHFLSQFHNFSPIFFLQRFRRNKLSVCVCVCVREKDNRKVHIVIITYSHMQQVLIAVHTYSYQSAQRLREVFFQISLLNSSLIAIYSVLLMTMKQQFCFAVVDFSHVSNCLRFSFS